MQTNTMIKYYYTCPIKAAYMAEYHGMDFEAIDYRTDISEPASTEDLLDFDYYLACQKFPDKNKIYLKKGSEYLVEPKEGDIVDRNDPISHNNFYKATKGDIKAFEAGDWELSIIMRDNKQFFMPEVEND